jgi:MoaA/NifB/PqqE/SkfB family radical SAM enzyme
MRQAAFVGRNRRERALFGLYRESAPRFYWCVTWHIHFACNQDCIYCFNKSSPSVAEMAPDYEKALAELARVKPKHLCISGGEPTLVPEIVPIIRRLREGCGEGMQIEFNSNCTGRPELLPEILPHANILAASIDGAGEVNREQRGVDGDVVLAAIEKIATHPYPSWSRFRRIMAVPTATIRSYARLPELFDRLREIKRKSPLEMSVEVKPVFPYHKPLSPASRPEAWEDFVARSREWEKEYKEIRVEVRGVSAFSGLNRGGGKMRSKCWRQFFTAMLWPNGIWTYCKPDWFSRNYFIPSYRDGGRRDKLRAAIESVHSLFLAPCDLTCYAPCEHGENLDRALSAGRASALAEEAERIGLSIPPGELRDVCAFIKRRCNPSLVMDLDRA